MMISVLHEAKHVQDCVAYLGAMPLTVQPTENAVPSTSYTIIYTIAKNVKQKALH